MPRADGPTLERTTLESAAEPAAGMRFLRAGAKKARLYRFFRGIAPPRAISCENTGSRGRSHHALTRPAIGKNVKARAMLLREEISSFKRQHAVWSILDVLNMNAVAKYYFRHRQCIELDDVLACWPCRLGDEAH